MSAVCAPLYAQNTDDENVSQDLSALRRKLGRLHREMSLLMKDIVSNASSTGEAALGGFGADVNIDVLETGKDIVVKADLPGMDKDKINITLESGRLLKISGEREMAREEKSPGVVRQERFFGSFSKVVELPAEALNTGIKATYENGVLQVVIPKKTQGTEKPVTITVK